MTIIELTPAEFVSIIKALNGSCAKTAGIDLDAFLTKTKEQFAEVTKPFYKEATVNEFAEKTSECEKCCLPHNHSEVSGDTCKLYAYEPCYIKKLSPKENPSHD